MSKLILLVQKGISLIKLYPKKAIIAGVLLVSIGGFIPCSYYTTMYLKSSDITLKEFISGAILQPSAMMLLGKNFAKSLGLVVSADTSSQSSQGSGSASSDTSQSAKPIDHAGDGNGGTISHEGPDYPRIASVYGSSIGSVASGGTDDPYLTSGQSGSYSSYWQKIDLFIGAISVAYNFNKDWTTTFNRLSANYTPIKSANPRVLSLAYDCLLDQYISSADTIPMEWYLGGIKQEIWPGDWRIDYPSNKTAIDSYQVSGISNLLLNRSDQDGIFWDTFSNVGWPWNLVDDVQALKTGWYSMINAFNMPATGFERINGVLSEEELNRVLLGTRGISYDEYLRRYVLWTTRSRKPSLTILQAYPRDAEMDPFVRAGWTQVQREAEYRRASISDTPMMRLGLTTALMGNGYYAYNYNHGGHWLYSEYNAPLGYPSGDPTKYSDGTWRRTFDNGLAIVNPTGGAIDVTLDREYQTTITQADGSTQTSHGITFTIPSKDGRIFVPYGG